jgi:hypothetical protein
MDRVEAVQMNIGHKTEMYYASARKVINTRI